MTLFDANLAYDSMTNAPNDLCYNDTEDCRKFKRLFNESISSIDSLRNVLRARGIDAGQADYAIIAAFNNALRIISLSSSFTMVPLQEIGTIDRQAKLVQKFKEEFDDGKGDKDMFETIDELKKWVVSKASAQPLQIEEYTNLLTQLQQLVNTYFGRDGTTFNSDYEIIKTSIDRISKSFTIMGLGGTIMEQLHTLENTLIPQLKEKIEKVEIELRAAQDQVIAANYNKLPELEANLKEARAQIQSLGRVKAAMSDTHAFANFFIANFDKFFPLVTLTYQSLKERSKTNNRDIKYSLDELIQDPESSLRKVIYNFIAEKNLILPYESLAIKYDNKTNTLNGRANGLWIEAFGIHPAFNDRNGLRSLDAFNTDSKHMYYDSATNQNIATIEARQSKINAKRNNSIRKTAKQRYNPLSKLSNDTLTNYYENSDFNLTQLVNNAAEDQVYTRAETVEQAMQPPINQYYMISAMDENLVRGDIPREEGLDATLDSGMDVLF